MFGSEVTYILNFTLIIILTGMQPVTSICKYGFFCKSLISLVILAVIVIILIVIDFTVVCTVPQYDSVYIPCLIVFLVAFLFMIAAGINIIILIIAGCCFWRRRREERMD